MCTGVEIALAVSATAAAASTGVAVANYVASSEAADAQKALVDQQRQALKAQQDAATAEASRQAGTGAVFGREDAPKALSTGFGFGSAPSSSPNSGRAQITGGF